MQSLLCQSLIALVWRLLVHRRASLELNDCSCFKLFLHIIQECALPSRNLQYHDHGEDGGHRQAGYYFLFIGLNKRIVCIKLYVTSVNLTANKQKLCLLLFQAQDKGRWQRLFSSFCSRTANEEEEIVHKLLGEKFQVNSKIFILRQKFEFFEVVTNKWCKLILCAPKCVVVPFIRDSWPCCVICLPQRCTKIVSVRSGIVSAVRLSVFDLIKSKRVIQKLNKLYQPSMHTLATESPLASKFSSLLAKIYMNDSTKTAYPCKMAHLFPLRYIYIWYDQKVHIYVSQSSIFYRTSEIRTKMW